MPQDYSQAHDLAKQMPEKVWGLGTEGLRSSEGWAARVWDLGVLGLRVWDSGCWRASGCRFMGLEYVRNPGFGKF